MRLLGTLAVLVCTVVTGVHAASAATCPRSAIGTSPDGQTYVTRVYADHPFSGSVEATFYAAAASYSAHVPQLSVSAASPDNGSFSKAIVFSKPAADSLLAAVLTFTGTGGSEPCIDRELISTRSQTANANQAFMSEGNAAPSDAPIALTYVKAEQPLACAEPYASARITHAVQPAYPLAERNAGVTGGSLVRVDLAADGSVERTNVFKSSGDGGLDEATLRAASASTYRAQLFRCEGTGGSYIFRADFLRTP